MIEVTVATGSFLDLTYVVNPSVVSSIKSVDSLAVFGASVPMEMPLALFQVLMAFAEKKTARQAFELLDVDVDVDVFGTIVNEFFERGLLKHDLSMEEGPSLQHFLSHRGFGDPKLTRKIAGAMQQGHAVVIPDALPADLAERAHQELDRSHRWVVDEGGHDFFHFRNSGIPQLERCGGALAECSQLFKNAATRRFIGALSAQDCAGDAHAGAAWYRPGDYALPHDDSNAQASRSVAYVWYLTKGWRQEWGGSLFWCPTGQYISPGFNVLVMFNVTQSNMHFICPVAPTATAKRLTINGFWHCRESRPARVAVSPEAWISRPACGQPALEEPELLPIIAL